MKRYFINIKAALIVVSLVNPVQARDFGVLLLPVHRGKFTSSLLYEHLKVKDDFDSRGRADFTSNVTGAQFSYGITDQVGVSVKGGVLLEPHEEAQGSQWESRAGYVYGVDLFNEVFPATPGCRPGVQVSVGATEFQVPFDRQISGGVVKLIDQKMSGVEYHGAVLATFKLGLSDPYVGVRGFGSNVTWQDNQANPGVIKGHAHGNISLVLGLPIQITKDIRFEAEGRIFSETAVTAGFTITAF